MKKTIVMLVIAFCIFNLSTVQAQNKCSATGLMGGEKFAANYCEAALLEDEHSITLWFNEISIGSQEKENFHLAAYASSIKDGKERTMLLVAFCPGGGKPAASPDSIKSISMEMTHAKSPLAGRTWVLEPSKDLKIEKMIGDIKPNGNIIGKMGINLTSGGLPYSFILEFDVKLPANSAASGVACK